MSLLPSRPDAEPAEDAGPRVIGLDDDAADEVLSALSSGTARSLLGALHDEPAPPSELADRCDTSLQNVQYHLEKLSNAGAVEVVDTAYSAKGREMDVYAPADQPLVVFAGDETDGSTLRTAIRRLLGAVGVLALASLLIQTIAGRGGLDVLAPSVGDGGSGGGGGGDGDTEFQDGDGGGQGDDAPTGGDADAPRQGNETASGGDGGTTTQTSTTESELTATEAPETVTDATETTRVATETAEETVAQTPARTVAETTTEAARETTTELSTTAADGARTGVEAAGSGLPPGLVFFAGGLFVLAVIAVVWYVGRR